MTLLALVLAVATARADQIPGTATTVAAWKIAAYDDKDGQFSHCAMSTPYRSGITMIFSVSADYSWRVGWTHNAWTFTKGQAIDLVLFVDGAGPYNLRARAATDTLAVAELPAKAALFDLMRKGYRMSVRAMGDTYAFSLTGTYAALSEILACVERYGGVVVEPAETPAPTVPDDEVTIDQRLEAIKVMANILAQGGMTGSRILNAREIAELNNDYVTRSHVAWRAEGMFGTLRVLPGGISPSEAKAGIVGDDVKACKGRFASGSTPDDKSPAVLRVFTACEERGKRSEYHYTLVPVGDGTHYLFTTIGAAESGDATGRTAKLETILRNAVHEVMKK